MTESRKLAAILAADLAGYSRLMGQDETATVRDLKAHQAVVLPMIGQFEGVIVDTAGDGILAQFQSAVRAVECAVAIQKIMAERNLVVPEDRRMQFRIGVHLGDIIWEETRVYGDSVNIAARLEATAKPGAICLSEDAYRQVRGRLDLAVTDLGPTQLKNIAEPVRIYSVQIGVPAEAEPAALEKASAPAIPDKPSIAVLAFNNMSGDAEQEYFSDGITEDIITDLSRLSDLHVIARNSSFVYKKAAISIPEVAKALDVRYVLEGSVRKAGNRVRVTAQLIDASSGGHVWASRFDRDLSDIFAVQDELTQEIVAALKLKLTAGTHEQLASRRAVDIQAYELFLRGRELAWGTTGPGNIAARDLFERAIAIDPNYAAAYALAAFTHLIDYANAFSDDPQHSLGTGLELAQRAVKMDDEEPASHFALGVAHTWRRELDSALAEAQRGLALAPNSVELLLLLANVQIFSGEPAHALETLDIYMRLDPHYLEITLQALADAHFSLGDYAKAISALEQRLTRNQQAATAYALLASCHGHLGHREEAQRAWENTMRLNPSFSVERRRQVLPYRKPEDFEHRVEGLRKAGLSF
ncbi:guanylyl cyclase [Labrys miyagiensis]|uniref:Guanylyl cyclase n=1 Tax=Labrys miyagiensis TaxID=346912 RepID=A0ABQ6CVL0_9HYPH|nr:adenylate/guanylate cyclase domain-containing protein [Labrys miyagiensis]GLS23858.1 guanylyl cyclase [Labrys miyagiensis]